MAQKEHSKIINKIASQILKPEGLERKGQSRTWYDDRNWFTTVIEFQPHKRYHGAALNVGVNLHWYAKSFLSFDIGYRETGFEKFETAQQFSDKIEPMVNLALAKALDFRQKMADLPTASETILNHHFTSDSLWGSYHKGIISVLTNEPVKARGYFESLLRVDHDVPWANELKTQTRELLELVEKPALFKQRISGIVVRARALKKLKPIEFHFD